MENLSGIVSLASVRRSARTGGPGRGWILWVQGNEINPLLLCEINNRSPRVIEWFGFPENTTMPDSIGCLSAMTLNFASVEKYLMNGTTDTLVYFELSRHIADVVGNGVLSKVLNGTVDVNITIFRTMHTKKNPHIKVSLSPNLFKHLIKLLLQLSKSCQNEH